LRALGYFAGFDTVLAVDNTQDPTPTASHLGTDVEKQKDGITGYIFGSKQLRLKFQGKSLVLRPISDEDGKKEHDIIKSR